MLYSCQYEMAVDEVVAIF